MSRNKREGKYLGNAHCKRLPFAGHMRTGSKNRFMRYYKGKPLSKSARKAYINYLGD